MSDPISERRPFHKFEHERARAVRVLEPVDGADMGMVQRGEDVRFPLEPSQPVGVSGKRGRQNLQGDVAIEPRVAGTPDFPHTACPERPENLVGTEVRSGREVHATPSYRYIVRSPDVRGGHARVEGTRIAVHDVIALLQNGETVDSVTGSCLPMLTKSQVYECLAYYEDHRGEIDLLVARQMADAHAQR